MTVVTGVSGSGKSSLVFDTLFAEGQRRYVESLSAYARQFVGRMNKPEVDYIRGIAPAIAIEQKVNTRNPRSTVATSTEIFDYLKLLFARVGKTYSPISGAEVKRHTVDDVVQILMAQSLSSRWLILSPINDLQGLGGELDNLARKGFSRVWDGSSLIRIEDFKPDEKAGKQKIYLMIDRIEISDDEDELRTRVADSVQTAFHEGQGECRVRQFDAENGAEPLQISFSNRFEADGITFEEPSPAFFNFNNAYGACKTCEGFGQVIGIDEDLVIPDKSLSVSEDAVAPWRGETMSVWKTEFMRRSARLDFPIGRPYSLLNEEEKNLLWNGGKGVEGIRQFVAYLETNSYKIQYRVMLSRYRGKTTCPDCKGTRMRKDAAYVKLKNTGEGQPLISLPELLLMQVSEASEYFRKFRQDEQSGKIAERLLKEITNRLGFLEDVGLGYLTLNRLSNTLSGGESQRINLATALGSSLVGSMYILDEPSIGLHPRDTERLVKVLKSLRDVGNTLVVVEHEEEVIKAADYMVDIGPFAGQHGGNLIYHGPMSEINGHDSLTAQYLSGEKTVELPERRRIAEKFISISGARQHNLKGITAKFPLQSLVAVTGVSGSGKTTLVKGILYPALQKRLGLYSGIKTGAFDKLEGSLSAIQSVELVDQNPIGKSSRSNPVTYMKAFDAIRELYAGQALSAARGYKANIFSFNVEGGRCETCQGEGEVTVEMQFMADIHLPCETCKGLRYKQEVLEVEFKGKNISQVLDMTVDEALVFFEGQKAIMNKLKPLADVGLGYIGLGQSSSILSGGEAQRVKLASFLSKGIGAEKVLFIFDEPTTGLHFYDISILLKALNQLIALGHSVIVIEHNAEVIKCADWVIDLGPDGGDAGGNLVYEGTPEGLADCIESHTGRFLKEKLKR